MLDICVPRRGPSIINREIVAVSIKVAFDDFSTFIFW